MLFSQIIIDVDVSVSCPVSMLQSSQSLLVCTRNCWFHWIISVPQSIKMWITIKISLFLLLIELLILILVQMTLFVIPYKTLIHTITLNCHSLYHFSSFWYHIMFFTDFLLRGVLYITHFEFILISAFRLANSLHCKFIFDQIYVLFRISISKRWLFMLRPIIICNSWIKQIVTF